ncbi:MAG: penicillin acylase family protein [Gemmatimonadota bacterium]|nr:penicillin acylase family protein [Gemmatimonadota bacterium]
MPQSRFGSVSALIALVVLGYAGARPIGPLPALGPFLDPANGIWAAALSAELPADATASIPGLGADTRVIYDDRDVPHIFATTVPDAYRALGYVVARDRLFQMEMQSRAGAGTLTELVGNNPQVMQLDQQTRELGMPRAAELRLRRTDTTSASWKLVSSFAAGVNSYVDGLKPRDYPIEFKLLSARPAAWSVLRTYNLLMRMGWTLAASNNEIVRLQASALVGSVAANALFAPHASIVDPIQPNGLAAARFDSLQLPPPGAPDTSATAALNAITNSGMHALASLTSQRGDDAVGSNNWAVAPSRSANGHALLAGDPHLDLSLPSIWYEVHMVVPGQLDVYGVTIPGAAGVVIGFNRDVAWTFTNVGADVMDYYLEKVDHQKSPTHYELDGVWKPLEIRQEVYRDPAGRTIRTDTVRYTHRGPLALAGARWVSIRWTVLESTRDDEAFERASRSRTAQAMLDGAAEVYEAPAQNMLVADRDGTIAIRSTGRYPIRPDNGRGDVLRDGSKSSSDWTGNWPLADYPQSVNPERGFLSSNNQEPLDPRVQPRYLGSNWERPWRAMRINQLLRADSAVTPDAMRQFQSDPGSARADVFVPAFIAAAAPSKELTPSEALTRAAGLLGQWDRRYTKDNKGAVLFEAAMQLLSLRLWDELQQLPVYPSDMVVASLLTEPDSPWWDDHRTAVVEHRDAILAAALASAFDSVTKRYGPPSSDSWRWDHVRFANIYHLLGLQPFSRLRIPVQGGSGTLWPSTGDGKHGPSWRMVVDLGPTVKAWGTYPGGQSGNPLSTRYDNHVNQWARGELDSLRVPAVMTELSAGQQHARLTLSPRR